jgi:hypothetical protein
MPQVDTKIHVEDAVREGEVEKGGDDYGMHEI